MRTQILFWQILQVFSPIRSSQQHVSLCEVLQLFQNTLCINTVWLDQQETQDHRNTLPRFWDLLGNRSMIIIDMTLIRHNNIKTPKLIKFLQMYKLQIKEKKNLLSYSQKTKQKKKLIHVLHSFIYISKHRNWRQKSSGNHVRHLYHKIKIIYTHIQKDHVCNPKTCS